jgi:hypothetical protein
MQRILFSLLILLLALPAMSQSILHSVNPVEGKEGSAFIAFNGITKFVGQYRQPFMNSDGGIRVFFGSEDPTTVFGAQVDYIYPVDFSLGGGTTTALDPFVSFYNSSTDIEILGVTESFDYTWFTIGCFGMVGYSPMPEWEFYGAPVLALYFGDEVEDDLEFDLTAGAIWQFNNKVKFHLELAEWLDDFEVYLGARFGL